jgi:glyoxylase-like metal-dependent hydrolase (beta-lactamase superfamily II)
MQSVSSRAPEEIYRVRVLKGGGEYGPAVSVYWNDRLNEYIDLNYYLVLIQNDKRTILINTGMPADFLAFHEFARAWHPSCRIYRDEPESTQNLLHTADVQPSEIETVVITPITVYTTGNLRLFEDSKFVFNRRGWIDFWAPEPHAPRLPRDIAIPQASREWLAGPAIDRIVLVEDEDTICPGVRCFRTGGHHVSSMAVCVDTEKGRVIVSDCFFTYDNLEKNIPIGWHENLHEIYAAYARIRAEADIAVPLYDPKVLERFPGGLIA